MTVYFLRHGIAERQSPGGDSARRLTEEGRSGLTRVLTLARRAAVKPELVLSSPYVRAKETARLAMEVLALEESLTHTDALLPSSTPPGLWSEVRAHGVDSLLVVSHEPLLSSTLAWALGSTKQIIQFPPAGLAAMDFTSTGPIPAGILRWMITAELG